MGDINKLYDNIKQLAGGKIEVGTVEQFTKALGNQDTAKKVYGNLSTVLTKDQIGSENDFLSFVQPSGVLRAPKQNFGIVPSIKMDQPEETTISKTEIVQPEAKQEPIQIPSLVQPEVITNPDPTTGAFTPEIAAGMRGEVGKQFPVQHDDPSVLDWAKDTAIKTGAGIVNMGVQLDGIKNKVIRKAIEYSPDAIRPFVAAMTSKDYTPDVEAAGKAYVEELNKSADTYKGQTITDLHKKGDYIGLAGKVTQDAISSLPMITMALMAPEVGLPMIGAATANEKYDSLAGRKDMSENEKVTNAVTSGVISAATLWAMGASSKYLGSITESVGKVGAEQTTAALKTGLSRWVTDTYLKAGIFSEGAMMGAQSVVAKIADNSVDYATNATDTFNPMKGTGEALISGAATGLAFGGLGELMKIPAVKEAKKNFDTSESGLISVLVEKGLTDAEVTGVLRTIKNVDPTLRPDLVNKILEKIPEKNTEIVDFNSGETNQELSLKSTPVQSSIENYFGALDNLKQTSSKYYFDSEKEKQQFNNEINKAGENAQAGPRNEYANKFGIDEVSAEKAQAEQQLVDLSNKTTGTIQTVKLKDNSEIQIANGAPIFKEDGTLDAEKTGIITHNPKDENGNPVLNEDGTPKILVVDPNSIMSLVSETPIQEAQAEAGSQIDQAVAENEKNDFYPKTYTDYPTKDGQWRVSVNETTGKLEKQMIEVNENAKDEQGRPIVYEIDDPINITDEEYSQMSGKPIPSTNQIGENGQSVSDVQSGSTPVQTAPVQEQTAPVYPTDKNGNVDFKSMTDEQIFNHTKETKGEDAAHSLIGRQITRLQGQIQDNTRATNKHNEETNKLLAKAKTMQDEVVIQAKQDAKEVSLKEEYTALNSKLGELQSLLPKVEVPAPIEAPKVVTTRPEILQLQKEQAQANLDSPETLTPNLATSSEVLQPNVDTSNEVQETPVVEESSVTKPKETQFQKRAKALGEYIDMKDYILRIIAGGQKIKWKGGLESEFRGSNAERLQRRNYIDETNGLTPTELAHQIWNDYGENGNNGEIPGVYNMSDGEILNEVHEVLRTVKSNSDALLQAEERRTIGTYDPTPEEAQIIDAFDDEMFAAVLGITNFTPEQITTLNDFINGWSEYIQHEQNSINPGTTPTSESNSTEGNAISEEGSIDSKITGQEPNLNPTDGQKEAGNYKLAHITISGMDISVENPVGSLREGKDEDGKAWSHEMKSHYGYFKGTVGRDGDHIDVFTKSNTPEDYKGPVFVIDQVYSNGPKSGLFDESKVMLGYDTAKEAEQAYMENYDKDWNGLSDMTEVSVDDFKKWLYDGAKQAKPFADYKETPKSLRQVTESPIKNGYIVAYEGKQYTINGITSDGKFVDLESDGKPLENVSVGDRVRFEDDGEELEGVVIEPMPYNKDGEVTVQVTWNNGQHHSKGAQVFNKTQKELENVSSGNKLPEQAEPTNPKETVKEEKALTDNQQVSEPSEKVGEQKSTKLLDTLTGGEFSKAKTSKKSEAKFQTKKLLTESTTEEVSQLTERLLSTGLAKEVKMVTSEEMTAILEGNEQLHAVYHGSPHSFDQFSLDHIGTGEGAQAYGHGLYFTDKKEIAKTYAGIKLNIDKNKNYDQLAVDNAEKYIKLNGGIVVYAIAEAKRELNYALSNEYDNLIPIRKQTLEILENNTDVKRNLYSVELHEGKQPGQYDYLRWEKPVSTKVKEKIFKQLRGENVRLHDMGSIKKFWDGESSDFESGDNMYGLLSNLLGSQKEASEFLLRAGIDGIQYPANHTTGKANETDFNYVVFDPSAITIKEKVQFMRKPDGTIYGFVKDGVVYLNSEKPNLNTPIHEFGHLFTPIIKAEHPEFYQKGAELIKESPYYNQVKNDPNYSNLDEDGIIDEAMNQAIGDKGEKVVEKGLFERLKEWIKGVWERIGAKFGIKNLTSEQIQDLTLNDWTDIINSELLSGNKLTSKLDIKKTPTIEIEGIQRSTTNSLGKPIHSTEEGVRNFWKWFGDSKVIDESGRPLVVYHGTNAEFNEFDTDVSYFSNNNRFASEFGNNVGEYYLSINNPYDFSKTKNGYYEDENGKEIIDNDEEKISIGYLDSNDEILTDIIGKGYDGAIEHNGEFIVTFDPTQIKSATRNDGSFSENNANFVEEKQIAYDNEQEAIKKTIDFVSSERPTRIPLDNSRGYAEIHKRSVVEGFKESGYVDFIGRKINSIDDVVDMWNIHRSPYIEKSHIIFVKDGSIVGTTATTLNKVGITAFGKVEDIETLYNKFGADGMYLLHNHPSGNHRPSSGDIQTTQRIKDLLPKVNLIGHIVIDHDKYSYIDPAKDGYKEFEQKNAPDKLFYERELVGKNPQKRLFEISKALLNGEGLKGAIIYLSPNLDINAYDVFPEGATQETISELTKQGLKNNLGQVAIITHDGTFDKDWKAPSNVVDVIDTKTGYSTYFENEQSAAITSDDILKLWEPTTNYPKPQPPVFTSSDTLVDQARKMRDHEEALQRWQERQIGNLASQNGERLSPTAISRLNKDINSVTSKLWEGWTDAALPIKEFQKFLEKNGVPISDNDNYYMRLTTVPSRIEYRFSQFKEDTMKPFIATLKAIEKNGFTYDDITTYAKLKHGPEYTANILVREYTNKIEAERAKIEDVTGSKDWTTKNQKLDQKLIDFKSTIFDYIEQQGIDYAGRDAIIKRTGESSLYTIKNFEDKNGSLVDEFWKQSKEVSHYALDEEVRGGMRTKESAEAIKGMFDYYVPLKGHREPTAETTWDYSMEHGDFFFSAVKKGKGRTSESDDPFSVMESTVRSAIGAAEQNLQLQSIRRLALKDTTGSMTVSKTWFVKVGEDENGNPEFKVADEVPFEDTDTNETYNDKVAKFEEKMKELKSKGEAYQGGSERLKLGLWIKPTNEREHEVVVKSNGESYTIRFHTSPRVPQAINGTNMRFYEGTFGAVLDGLGWATRHMAGFKTLWRPAFILVTNPIRDIHAGLNLAYIDEGAKFTGNVILNFRHAQAALLRRNLNQHWDKNDEGKKFISGKYDKMLNDFMVLGGKTGISKIMELKEIQKSIEKQMKSGKDPIGGVFDFYHAVSDITENQMRVSIYITAIEKGYSSLKATSMAKEATVNFDRKGNGRNGLRELKATYAFINVGFQALDNIYSKSTKNTETKKRALLAIAANVLSGSLLVAAINTAMCALFGWDEDKWLEDFSKRSSFARNANFTIWTPDKLIDIPLGQEFRMYHGLGMDLMMMSHGKVSVMETSMNMIKGLSSQLPYNPIESSLQGSWASAMPDFASPLAELAANKSWLGYGIYKQNQDESAPGYTKIKTNKKGEPYAPEVMIKLSKWLNEGTGGDAAEAGWLGFVNPDIADHLLGGYFAGIYEQPLTLLEGALSDKEGSLIKELTPRAILKNTADIQSRDTGLNEKYYKAKDEAEKVDKLIGRAEKAIELLDKKSPDYEAQKEKYQSKIDRLKTDELYNIQGTQKTISALEKSLDEISPKEQVKTEKEISELKKNIVKINSGEIVDPKNYTEYISEYYGTVKKIEEYKAKRVLGGEKNAELEKLSGKFHPVTRKIKSIPTLINLLEKDTKKNPSNREKNEGSNYNINQKAMKDYRKFNLKTLTTNPEKPVVFDTLGTTHNMDLVMKYSRMWSDLAPARKKRARAVAYGFGDQYSDLIKDEHGQNITEGQHIMNQGKVPIANNLIRGQVKTVIGQFRSNQTEPGCVARDRDEAKLGEMMSIAVQCAYQSNKLWELDARTLEEFLHSGVAIQKVGYAWNFDKQDMCETVDYVTLPRFFFNGDIEDPRGGDFTCMGEILDWDLSDIISKLCADDKEKALRISKFYNNVEQNIYSNYRALSKNKIKNLSFLLPTDRSKCRVICAWEKESKERLRVHDFLDGKRYISELTDKSAIDRLNVQRIKEATAQGVNREDVPLIEYEWFLDKFWYVRYLTPTGEVLYEAETPYDHKKPPYIVKVSMFDGENYSFVGDLIELNRGINRLSTLIDFIISASPKATFIIPEECLGLMSKEEIIDQYQMPGGVVMIKTAGLSKEQLPYTVSQNATNVGAYELLNLYMTSMKDVSGVYGALQGQTAGAGTPASLYAQQSQQSSVNLLDLMETFKSFREDRDILLMQVIQQFWDTPKYMQVAGTSYNEESKWYNPEKIRGVLFDLSITESASTPAFRTINNGLLLDLFKASAIGVKELLKAGSFPFGDKLLELLDAQEKQMQEGQVPGEIPPDLQAQIQAGQDPRMQQDTQAA